jgi:SHS2 domain-containing protein
VRGREGKPEAGEPGARVFEFVEGPTGDLSFVARGAGLGEVFAAAAEALLCATVDDPASVAATVSREIALEEPDVELLLLRFLNELVWLRDAAELLLRVERIELRPGPPAQLEATLQGQQIDRSLHALRSDVKAATAHGLRVAPVAGGWEARATLDV